MLTRTAEPDIGTEDGRAALGEDYSFARRIRRAGERGVEEDTHRFEVRAVEGDLTTREVPDLEVNTRGTPMQHVDKDGKLVMRKVPHAEMKHLSKQRTARSMYSQNAVEVAQALANETGQPQAVVNREKKKVEFVCEPQPDTRKPRPPRDRY